MVLTLLHCSYSLHVVVQSPAANSVCNSEIQTLAAIPLFAHVKTLHTLAGMGSTALAAAAAIPSYADLNFLHWINEASKIKINKQKHASVPTVLHSPLGGLSARVLLVEELPRFLTEPPAGPPPSEAGSAGFVAMAIDVVGAAVAVVG